MVNTKEKKKKKKRPEKKEKAMLKITMPPNATKAEIKKHIKNWKSILKTFADLTGEKEFEMFEIDEETGEKKKI